jgi:ketosteroid isomerase-like protein
MRKLAALSLLIFVLAPLVLSRQKHHEDDAVRSLVANEREFARAASARGTRDAFLSFIADDGVLFRPGPVNGKEWLLKSKPGPGLLSWEPSRAEVSSSEDLGYTTGPWSYRPSAASKASAFGQFVTVWKRQADGTWRFAIDHGIDHPEYHGPVPALKMMTVRPSGHADPELVRTTLEKADAGLQYVSITAVADDVLLLRPNAFPVDGKSAFASFVADNPGTISCRIGGSGISKVGDLGYTWGSAEFRPQDEPAQKGNYLRIWRNTRGGWKLVLDLFTPSTR